MTSHAPTAATPGTRRAATADEIDRYVTTGDHDADGGQRYPGKNIIERMTAHSAALRSALGKRVEELETGLPEPSIPAKAAGREYLGKKLRPMVEGLFIREDQPRIIEVVTSAVAFITRDAAHQFVQQASWHSTAWDVAGIWLDSIDAPPLSDASYGLLGLSEGTRCLVSLRYFRDIEDDAFADYVVHEVAHLFHNNKRTHVGLGPRGRCEWMLDIEFQKRELFAHACEFYSRIAARAQGQRDQGRLVDEFAPRAKAFEDELDPAELIDVLHEAARARNGWRRILRRCAPPSRRR